MQFFHEKTRILSSLQKRMALYFWFPLFSKFFLNIAPIYFSRLSFFLAPSWTVSTISTSIIFCNWRYIYLFFSIM